jgi:hypothetical protein
LISWGTLHGDPRITNGSRIKSSHNEYTRLNGGSGSFAENPMVE